MPSTFGVLRLTLGDGSYDWRFVPALDARSPTRAPPTASEVPSARAVTRGLRPQATSNQMSPWIWPRCAFTRQQPADGSRNVLVHASPGRSHAGALVGATSVGSTCSPPGPDAR